MTTVPPAPPITLELDDIQSGALHERPSPYVGTYILLRIDDPTAGRALVRRLYPLVETGRTSETPARGAWLTVAFTYQGLRALGVPQASLDSFAPEFRQGMAARAARLGDVGESAPEHWEMPLGTPDVHVALAFLAQDQERLEQVRERARQAHEDIPGVQVIWRQECYQLPDRPDLLRLQGWHRPGGRRGQRQAATNSHEQPLKAGEIILGYPDETGELPPMPMPDVLGRNGTYIVFRKLHTRVAAYRQYLREQGREPRGRGAPRGQDGGPLAERGAPRPGAGARRSRARRRPAAEQRLQLRRRSARLQVPRRLPRATGESPRRARRRRQRQHAPAPHDPARHELRPDAARRRARGRRCRPRDRVRVRGRAHHAAVRVRQDPVAERRDLHRRAGRARSARGAERRRRHASPSRSGRSAAV